MIFQAQNDTTNSKAQFQRIIAGSNDASRKTAAEITKYLNARQVEILLGKAMNKNSLHRLLQNKRYVDIKDTEPPDGMPSLRTKF